jgi:hypothetical protein
VIGERHGGDAAHHADHRHERRARIREQQRAADGNGSACYPRSSRNTHPALTVAYHIGNLRPALTRGGGYGIARRRPPRKVTYFEPVLPRLPRNSIIESSFEVGRRFRCTMRINCGELDPGAVIRPVPGEWHPYVPERLDQEQLADWRAGRNAVYQLAARTIGARLAVADGIGKNSEAYIPISGMARSVARQAGTS